MILATLSILTQVQPTTQVTGIKHDADGKVAGATCRDSISGEEFTINAKSVINATGPFTDSIRQMDNGEAETICSPSSGVHIVLPGIQNISILNSVLRSGRNR